MPIWEHAQSVVQPVKCGKTGQRQPGMECPLLPLSLLSRRSCYDAGWRGEGDTVPSETNTKPFGSLLV